MNCRMNIVVVVVDMIEVCLGVTKVCVCVNCRMNVVVVVVHMSEVCLGVTKVCV